MRAINYILLIYNKKIKILLGYDLVGVKKTDTGVAANSRASGYAAKSSWNVDAG